MVGDDGVCESPVDSGFFSCFRRDDKSDSYSRFFSRTEETNHYGIVAFSVILKKNDESDYCENPL